MALDLNAIRDETRDILYGTGLGEKPTLIGVSSTPAVQVNGRSVSFDLTTGTGDKIRSGDVLSVYDAASAADAFVLYVVDVTGDHVTCVNGYEGSPDVSASDLAGVFLEVMPLVSEHKMYASIGTVVDRFLWPEVFEISTGTVMPDLVSGQVALDSRDEEILAAWQKVGASVYPLSFRLVKEMDVSLFASGAMGCFDFVDASKVFYTVKRRVSVTDSDGSDSLYTLIATGAAAVALGATHVETSLDSSKKDAQDRGDRDKSSVLWRDFLTQKQVFSEDLSRDTVTHFVVERN